MNLDFAKVCGKHSAVYEAYYKQIDPKGAGAIEAMTAAKFLKKSGLSDVVLSRVWDLSDPNGKGFLDKPGFFVALKLVSLAQAGQVINMSNIYTETANPPKVGDLPKIMPPRIQTVPVSSGGIVNGDWSISVIDRLKYEQLFESLKPVSGMLPGNKVKGVLMDSKLPMETLGKIWDLADQDKDGNLDKHEFIVAMHLVYQTLEKRTVPDVLPVELRKPGGGGGVGGPPPKPAPPVVAASTAVPSMPRAPSGDGFGDGGFVANFPKDIAPPPAIPPLPVTIPSMTRVPPVSGSQPLIPTDPLIPIGAPPSVTANADWVVTPAEMKRFEVMFRDSDRDKDGLVSGLEVKNVFLQSGVPQNCLAHIWALCDTNQSGKLTLEQFALAMWMVERKQKCIEPPQVLTANMVPPSMRSVVSGVDVQPQVEPKPTYTNPELEMISKEIEELAKERRALETEIAQKEADIRIKSGEVRSLQSELDTLSATLKQLENQRGEAQKRLDDLKAQVNKVREQCQKQEETINEQEGELNAKRSELQKLKDEEASLQKEYDQNNRELQKLTQHLQNTQLQISSVRSMVTQLMETQRQMTDALLMCRAAISNQDAELVSEYQLKIEPDMDEARKTLEKKIEEPKADDPFDENSSMATKTNGFATNGFSSDPFSSQSANTTGRSGFDDSFNTASGFDSGFDAFGNSIAFNQQKDPFGGDAFGGSKPNNAVTPEPGKDDFGSDPFAALHAPTGQGQVLSPNTQKSGPPPRPESPSPALPPKKSKVPPPRPAPPRPIQGPARATQPAMDAFGVTSTSSSGGGGFADFADFDNKLSHIPPPPQPALALATLAASSSHTLSSHTFDTSSTTTSVTSATTASISTTSQMNNHLTRSTTPLQQAVTAFGTTLAGDGKGGGSSTSRKTPVISGPTDFSDDPFKDYRYEDPFNIKDPFADDEFDTDPEKVFKDDLCSDDDDKFKDTNDALKAFSAVSVSQPFSTTKQTPLSNEFLDQFDAFNMNPSPASSHQSSTTGVVAAGGGDGGGGGGGSNSVKGGNSKSKSITPVPTSGGLFDDFADFDAFSTKSTSSTLGSGRGSAAFPSDNTTKTNDSFFDAFNDNFETNSNVEVKNICDAFSDNKVGADAFDAFAATTTKNSTTASAAITKSSKVFEDFNDNFEDDFFKTKTTPTATSTQGKNLNFSTNSKSDKNQSNIDNFAQFDAFNDSTEFATDFAVTLNDAIISSNKEPIAATTSTASATLPTKLTKVQNLTSLSKVSNPTAASAFGNGENGAKLAEKFAADYSKPDTFDADLEEALKRSMLDK